MSNEGKQENDDEKGSLKPKGGGTKKQSKIPKKKFKKKKAKFTSEITDVYEEYMISTGYIDTHYGKLRVRFSGTRKKNNLVLFIHGSGVSSSSDHYYDLIKELYVRENCKPEYFYAAIDCPGYGKSKGSRQSIRSYPVKVIRCVCHLLGFKKAYACYGHSQGGASIFNGMIMYPNICDVLIQDRPVFAKSKLHELCKIKKPCLLDVDDRGHPVSVGKLVAKRLPSVKFITYSSKKNDMWWTDFFPSLMLEFLKNPKTGELEQKKTKKKIEQKTNKGKEKKKKITKE